MGLARGGTSGTRGRVPPEGRCERAALALGWCRGAPEEGLLGAQTVGRLRADAVCSGPDAAPNLRGHRLTEPGTERQPSHKRALTGQERGEQLLGAVLNF